MNQPSRDECAHRLGRHIGQGESVVLMAPPGSGRSTLLEQLARQLAVEPALVRGRECVAGIPFVPFTQLLVAFDAPLDEPLKVYTELPLAVAERGLAVLVDDGDGLDRASAVLVAQLHRAGVPCVLVLPGSDAAPDGLAETSSRWPVIDLPALGLPEVSQLAEDVLEAPLVAPAVAELARLSSGLPALVVGLLGDAVRADLVETTAGGVRPRAFVVGDRLLGYAVRDPSLVHDAAAELEMIAVAGRLPEELLGSDTVGRLVRAGLVRVAADGVEVLAPLVSAWALGRLSVDQRRRRLQEISQELLARRDLLGTDMIWVEHADLLAAAAGAAPATAGAVRWLTAQGRLDEADRLVPRGADEYDWDRALARAEIDIAMGQTQDAVAAIDAVEHLARSEDRARDLVALWTGALGGRLADHDGLKERVERVLPRFTDPRERSLLANAFDRRRAIVGRGELIAESDDPVFWALRESMTGSLDRAREVAAASDAGRAAEDVDDEEQLKVLAHFLSLVYDGRLSEGRELAERHHRVARDEGRPVLGLWTYNLSKIAFHAGQYDESARRALEARRQLAWRDVAGQTLPTEAMYAAALARLGRYDQAEAVVAGLAAEERLLPRVAIGVARVEAERLRSQGRVAEAAGRLASAGEYAVGHDEAHSGLLAVDESFMLAPAAPIAELLESLRDKSALVAAFADRATAVISDDPDALVAVAARFEQMVQPGRAAHAWNVAGELYRARRQSERARTAFQNAVRVSSQWRVTPWPVAAADDSVLTDREWEVARRAARRERSREIAEDLGLSIRTVDNHLTRVYRKLGISGRDELAAVIGSE